MKGLIVILNSIIALSTLIAAYFELKDRWQNEKEKEISRETYYHYWKVINLNNYLELPKIVIRWVLLKKQLLIEFLSKNNIHRLNRNYLLILIMLAPFIGSLSLFLKFDLNVSIIGFVFLTSTSLLVFGVFKERFPISALFFSFIFFFAIIGSFLYGLLVFVFLSLITDTSIMIASVLSIFLIPVFALFFSIPFEFISIFNDSLTKEEYESLRISGNSNKSWVTNKNLALIGSSISISFFITFTAILLGLFLYPKQEFKSSEQLLLINVLCDGLTLIITISLFNKVIKGKLTTISALIFDLFFCAILAVISIYFGLLGTEYSLSLNSSIFLLIGYNTKLGYYYLGPEFFIMHTTFIPTFIILFVIFVAWIGKLIILPISKILQKGKEIEKPHRLSAGVFLLISSLLFMIKTIIENYTT